MMKKQIVIVICSILVCAFVSSAWGQTHESYRALLSKQVASPKIPGPEHLRDYVSAGKLRLGLNDAILLTLQNNSDIRIRESTVENAKFSLLGAYKPFDPTLQTILNGNRNSYLGFNLTQTQGTFSELTQSVQATYSQMFQTGTNIQVQLLSSRNSSNSGFTFINPYYYSTLNLQFSQHFLRNRWRFENRAPLILARNNLQQSRSTFEAEVNDAVLLAVIRYWTVIGARGNLEVFQKSLEAAEATYQHDKRALELGALPPLDIYRSEADVASRRVQVIQAEYALKQAEDDLRFTIGAEQDPYIQALDLDLTERPELEGELRNTDEAAALREALAHRPEVQAAQHALQYDETNVRLAHNHLQPDLSLTGFYQSTGVGGNEFSLTTGQLAATGGVGTSFHQLFGFGYPGYGASLTLTLPIRNRAAQADLGSALVNRHRDLYSSQQVREQVTLDVSNAVHRLEVAKLTLVAGTTALDLAQKTLAAEQRKAELGAQSVFFLLDAQTRVATAEANLLQAQINYRTAVATLDHAIGHLLDAYRVQLADLTP